MEFRNSEIYIKGSVINGVLIALLAPAISLLILLAKYPILLTGNASLSGSEVKNLIFQVISLGLLINVGLFFYFLNKRKEHTSRGILSATLIILILAVIHKYLL